MPKLIFVLAALALAASCGKPASPAPSAPAKPAPIAPVETEAPAGEYRLDKFHSTLVFTVSHIGFSNYTGQFRDFDATLTFDPKAPATMAVTATIDVGSLSVPPPPEGFLETLKGPEWLDAARHPTITFRSTAVTLTGPASARVDGELSLHGLTAPVAFDATFNGGYAGFSLDPNARIGFSAKGSLMRSAFGVSLGVPTEEQPIGVGDAVTFVIEAEFTGPPLAEAPQ